MVRIKHLLRLDSHVLASNAAIPILALAVACLPGCAPTAVTQKGGAAQHAAAAGAGQKPGMGGATCSKPTWTAEALARGFQGGTTSLRFLIDTDGSVAQSSVAQSSGDASLDDAARAALAKCRFRPIVPVKGGAPQQTWKPVQYVWTR